MSIQSRGMPARFMDSAPELVRKGVIDIFQFKNPAPLEFDIVLRPGNDFSEITGLDFGKHGTQGQHFFLKPHEARAYRERNRRNRVAWAALPEATQKAVLAYLES